MTLGDTETPQMQRRPPGNPKTAAHRVKVEFDDAQAVARALGVPVRDIIAAAERLSQS